jgi:hypothetical protein
MKMLEITKITLNAARPWVVPVCMAAWAAMAIYAEKQGLKLKRQAMDAWLKTTFTPPEVKVNGSTKPEWKGTPLGA